MAAKQTSTVFIGSIPFDATEQQIHEIFSNAGAIKSLRLVTDKETGKSKGYGFCEYHDPAAADSAVRNIDQHELSGRRLRVSYADENTREAGDRWRGPGRDRERDRDRDRDRDRERRPERDGPRGAVGPGALPGSKPVGAAAAASAASVMAGMLGGPPAPGPAQGRVNSVLGGMSPIQLYEVMGTMRNLIQQNPAQARHTLISNPQLTKALFQAQILLGMVKPPPGMQGLAPPAPGPNQPAPASQPVVLPAAGAPGAGPLYTVAGAPGGAALNVQGAPVQVIAIAGENGQGVQYSIVQPGLPSQPVIVPQPVGLPAPAAVPPPAPAPAPAPVPAPAPAALPAPLPQDQTAILAQVMRMTQEQIDALPEATRQQVMQVKQLLMGAQAT